MPRFIVTTLQGLEPSLEQELKALGASEIEVLNRACAFVGDKKMLYRVNYEVRTAIRVMYPVLEFEAKNDRELYNYTQHLEWDKFMDVKDTFAIRAVVSSDVFTHSHYTGLKVKDAIADQFREKYNIRPNVDTHRPTLLITIYVKGTHCTILIDASGESLHMRGYRREQLDAPLNEVLAAGMLLMAEYDGSTPFLDPMCGSGTLAVEAAMIAKNIPAQKFRKRFAFEKWKNYDKALWEQVKAEAEERIVEAKHPIYAKDSAPRGRNATAINAMSTNLENVIEIEKANFFKEPAPAESGIIVMNPPYDERLGLEDAAAFYRKIGDTFKKEYSGWKAWIISSHTAAFKQIGLKTYRRYHVKNGPLECYYRGFEMRSGKFYADKIAAGEAKAGEEDGDKD